MKNLKLLTCFLFCIGLQYTQAQTINDDLVSAASDGDLVQVKALIAKGAKINTKDNKGKTALIWALKNEEKEMVDYLLSVPAINAGLTDEDGKSVLHYLYNSDKLSSYTNTFVSKGAKINAKDSSDYTPLMLAAKNKSPLAVKALLDNGADASILYDEETAFDMALNKGDEETIEAFIYGKPTKQMLNGILCNSENLEIIQKAITMGADINSICDDDEKMSLIFITVKNDELELVTLLIKNGANINAKSVDGTPLLFYSGNLTILKLLIANKVDIKATDAKNNTILIDCFETTLNPGFKNNFEQIKFWVENGLEIPKTIQNKPILKYIDEYTYEFPKHYKKSPENEAQLAKNCSERKETLKTYLKSKGIK